MVAAFSGHNDIISFLMESGADLTLVDDEGATALHKAAQEGQIATVKLLLGLGAKRDTQDSKGRTPKDVAKSEEVKQLLE